MQSRSNETKGVLRELWKVSAIMSSRISMNRRNLRKSEGVAQGSGLDRASTQIAEGDIVEEPETTVRKGENAGPGDLNKLKQRRGCGKPSGKTLSISECTVRTK